MDKKIDKETGLTLSHYKEPLTKVPDGYGYYGALLNTIDGNQIQCHVCGELFKSLSFHINQKHKLNAKEYREKFQLARTTALVSESMREQLKNRTIAWFNSLTPAQQKASRARSREMWQKYLAGNPPHGQKISLEAKNKRGTCPDQLLEKIKEVADRIGHTPSLGEFMNETNGQRYKHIIYATFGSWKNALAMLGMQPKSTIRTGKRRRYSDEELLEYLERFYQDMHRIPTATDSKRGLLPAYELYRRFGGMPKAREMVGIVEGL